MSVATADTSPTPPSEPAKLAAVLRLMAASPRGETDRETTYFLSSSTESERVELTPELFSILKSAAHALQRGQSIAIHRRDHQITTQQAADLLGVSRPTVVKLIDEGVLSATVPGAERRKLRLAEVLAYRDRLHEERSSFIAESASDYDHYSADDIQAALAELRRAADS